MSAELSAIERLPRETKNEIFSYLLLGKNVQYTEPVPSLSADDLRQHEVAPEIFERQFQAPKEKFAFETAVCRTSKSLGGDARACIYSANVFVVVRHRFPHFASSMERKMIPVVSEHLRVPFAHHALEATFEFSGSYYSGRPVMDARPRDMCTLAESKAMLMLADHLPAFCRKVQGIYRLTLGYHVHLPLTSMDDPVKLNSLVNYDASTTRLLLDLKSPPFQKEMVTEAEMISRQAKLLMPFSQFSNLIDRVEILGAIHPEIIKPKNHSLRPAITNLEADGFELLNYAEEEKAWLDNLAAEGKMSNGFLWRSYTSLASFTLELNVHFNYEFHAETVALRVLDLDDADAVANSWQPGVIGIGIDCFLTANLYQLRNRDLLLSDFNMRAQAVTHQQMFHYMHSVDIGAERQAQCFWLRAILNSCLMADEAFDASVSDLPVAHYLLPLNEDIEHDMNLIGRLRHGSITNDAFLSDCKLLKRLTIGNPVRTQPKPADLKINVAHYMDDATVKGLTAKAKNLSVENGSWDAEAEAKPDHDDNKAICWDCVLENLERLGVKGTPS